jgi:hypothetical protein
VTGPPETAVPEASAHFFPPRVLVPYVAGYLRQETQDAMATCGQRVEWYPIDAGDPFSYARWLQTMWNTGGDLIITEHDMVPTAVHVRRLLACEAEWCGHPYHVGEGRYATGLGFCKFSHNLMRRRPLAAQHAAQSPRTGGGLMPWQGLNESIERALTRAGEKMHVHEGAIPHLHYPEPQHAG